jgi:hypothetical protein
MKAPGMSSNATASEAPHAMDLVVELKTVDRNVTTA